MNPVAINPCPCGQTPTEIVVHEDYAGEDWSTCSGNCCGFWAVEFPTCGFNRGPELDEIMIEIWNDSPRGEMGLDYRPRGEELR